MVPVHGLGFRGKRAQDCHIVASLTPFSSKEPLSDQNDALVLQGKPLTSRKGEKEANSSSKSRFSLAFLKPKRKDQLAVHSAVYTISTSSHPIQHPQEVSIDGLQCILALVGS